MAEEDNSQDKTEEPSQRKLDKAAEDGQVLSSKETAIQFKEKIREEIRNGLSKENILSKEDAVLLNQFYEKIKQELNSSN